MEPHDSSFLMPNFITKFERGHPEREREVSNKGGVGKINQQFSIFKCEYHENGSRYG